jgi:membrane-bound ClpP family serine protease
MGLRSLIGAVLLIFGIGGIYSWVAAGLSSAIPSLGIVLCLIGSYLIYTDLRRKRKIVTVDKTTLTIASLLGAVVGGTIALEELKSRLSTTSSRDEQIRLLEEQLESLRYQGRISDDKYQEIKAMIENVKAGRRSG